MATTCLCSMLGREEWGREGEAKELVLESGRGEFGGGKGCERGRGGRSEGGACWEGFWCGGVGAIVFAPGWASFPRVWKEIDGEKCRGKRRQGQRRKSCANLEHRADTRQGSAHEDDCQARVQWLKGGNTRTVETKTVQWRQNLTRQNLTRQNLSRQNHRLSTSPQITCHNPATHTLYTTTCLSWQIQPILHLPVREYYVSPEYKQPFFPLDAFIVTLSSFLPVVVLLSSSPLRLKITPMIDSDMFSGILLPSLSVPNSSIISLFPNSSFYLELCSSNSTFSDTTSRSGAFDWRVYLSMALLSVKSSSTRSQSSCQE